jgi:hypothetical protein
LRVEREYLETVPPAGLTTAGKQQLPQNNFGVRPFSFSRRLSCSDSGIAVLAIFRSRE